MVTKLDPEVYAQVYVKTNDKTLAYKEAGGQAKHVSQAAAQFHKQDHVRAAIEQVQFSKLGDVRNRTLESLDHFLQTEYHNLDAKEKGNFLIKMVEKTGLDAPKKIDVTRTEVKQVNLDALVDQLAELKETNPAVAALLAEPVEGEVVEEPRSSAGAGGDSSESGEQ